MRVLYLTHHLPWPVFSGGRLREAELLQRLAARFEIDLVAVSKTLKQDLLARPSAAALGINARIFAARPKWMPHRSPLVRRHHSAEAREYVSATMRNERYDVVHVEGYFLLDLLPAYMRERAVLVEHNVESSLFEQRLRMCTGPRERISLLRSMALTRRDEQKAWRAASSVVTVTEGDAAMIRRRVPNVAVSTVPNGFDHLETTLNDLSQGVDSQRYDLLMVGNFGYQPSEDAALRLINQVFPLICNRRPATTLALVGDSPTVRMLKAAEANPNITITGRVPDVGEWLDRAALFVCPLRIGGGIKVKILEALARGRVVVTTPIGRQGLDAVPADLLFSCANDSSIAETCLELIRDPSELGMREARIPNALSVLPTWDDAASMLAELWQVRVNMSTVVGVGG